MVGVGDECLNDPSILALLLVAVVFGVVSRHVFCGRVDSVSEVVSDVVVGRTISEVCRALAIKAATPSEKEGTVARPVSRLGTGWTPMITKGTIRGSEDGESGEMEEGEVEVEIIEEGRGV